MTWTVLLDGLVALLLAATIAYCVVLNRRLGALRRNEGELSAMLARFAEAAARAEASVARLKRTGEDMADSLRDRIEEARAVYDDLSFIVDRSDDLATRLAGAASAEEGAATPREAGGPGRAPGHAPGHAQGPELSRAERELLEALDAGRAEAGR